MAVRITALVVLSLTGCGPHVSTPAKPVAAAPETHSLVGKRLRALDSAHAQAIDAFANDAATRLHVPGAAIAIVVGGKVVHEAAIGVRVAGGSDPVTSRTLFMIGSITKPITTLMEATLVDAGLVRWDTPLTTLLPQFAVDDADLTRRLVLWHASCACSGIGSQDVEGFFQFEGVTPERRIEEMRRMKPIAPLGERYFYSNAMVALGGYAAAHAAKPGVPLADAYAQVLKSNVLDPIGMTSSTLDFAAAQAVDHAMPHAAGIDGTVQPIPLAYEKSVLPVTPAGGIWSNVHDMERYVVTEMQNGVTADGKRVVSEANLAERRKMRIKSEGEDGYGLGIDVGHYDGLPIFAHDGGAWGYGASMLLFPEQSVAIIILTNVRNGGSYALLPFNRVVERKIVEALFEGAEETSASMIESFVAARRDLAAKQSEGLERDPPAEWARSIAGTYTHPILGTVILQSAAHGGVLDAGEWKSAFGRRIEKDGSVKLVLVDPPFAGGAMGVKGSTLLVETSSGDLPLQRAPSK